MVEPSKDARQPRPTMDRETPRTRIDSSPVPEENTLTRTVSLAGQPLLSSSELGVLFMLKRTLFLGLLLVASELATGCCCCGGWRPFWRRCCESHCSSCYTPSSGGSNCSSCGGSSPIMGDYSQPPAGPTMPQSVPLTRR